MRRTIMLASCFLAACGVGGSGPSDGSSPLVNIDAPLPNATVGGQVSIDITAVDDFGIDEVRVLIDGVEHAKLFTAPFHTNWNTVQLADNSVHTIRVEARDLARNLGSKSITVTVLNAPQ